MQEQIATVTKAKKFINEKIQVTPEEVSLHCNYSPRQLSRIFEMITGATLGEFLRWTRLSKSLYSLKYSDEPILDIALKSKYESQEAFTRIFKNTFGITPGEYRKIGSNIMINGNSHLLNIVEEASHEAANNGHFKEFDVNIMHVIKPSRYWINFESNKKGKPPHEFWNTCEMVCESEFDKIIPAEYIIGYGAAYLTMIETKEVMRRMSWGLEVDGSFDIETIDSSDCGKFRIVEGKCDIESLNTLGYDIFKIPESKYVVFNIPQHIATDDHGGAVRSIWELVNEKYNYSEHGLEWNHQVAPIYEDSSPNFGETVWVPVKSKGSVNK